MGRWRTSIARRLWLVEERSRAPLRDHAALDVPIADQGRSQALDLFADRFSRLEGSTVNPFPFLRHPQGERLEVGKVRSGFPSGPIAIDEWPQDRPPAQDRLG